MVPEQSFHEKPKNPVLDPKEAEKIRSALIEKYQRYKQTLTEALQHSRKESQDSRRMLTVVVSLFDEDDTLLSVKMFEHSFRRLVEQAKKDHLRLDFLIVANNSGGKTTKIAAQIQERIATLCQENSDVTFNQYLTHAPESISPATEWRIPSLALTDTFPTSHRVSLIVQPAHRENRGKPRAIRDVAHHLCTEVTDHGYAPDAIFQMDAETLLEFVPPHARSADITPLGQLFLELHAPGTIAVGTKDKFAIMDETTGKPTRKPVPAPQEGYMYLNRNEVTIPGGAAMVRPADYIAGMMAITEVTTGSITEDYMFTRLIQEANGAHDANTKKAITRTIDSITHLNRSSQDKEAEQQIARWRAHAHATDLIFPSSTFDSTPYRDYFFHVATKRFRDTLKTGNPLHLYQAATDLYRQRSLHQLVTNQIPSDPIHGNPEWYRKDSNK